MCGICGILNHNSEPISRMVLRRMTDILAHRGPDSDGIFIDDGVGLGHRRLAILDLSSAGYQPMMSPEGRYVISYNGEIYNYTALRKELISLGYSFQSNTDTEVVLQAYAEWGIKALNRFNGMFAFAIWDKQEKTLTLCRDRYGIKPLYYLKQGSTFLFASEIKSILQHPDVHPQMNTPALLEYFTFQNFFTDQTLIQNVCLLPAGSWMQLNVEQNGNPTPQIYWDYSFEEPENPASEAEYSEELDRLFQHAVQSQLVSDVEVGAYLSGGIDSGAVTSIAASQIPFLRSFTCGFDLHSASGLEISCDEREIAEYMSYLYKTEHYEMVLKAGDMERIFPQLAWHIEEPRVGQSYPNLYAAQLASKFVKVILAGTGGDEIFGGYPWRYYRAVVNDNFEDYIDKYYVFWQRLIPNVSIKRVFQPVWNDVKDVWTRDIFRDVFRNRKDTLSRPEDYVNHSLYLESKTFLQSLLIVEDKLSMAHGLETRVPFLDHDLVDFAMKLPVNMKLANLGEVVRLNENEQGAKAEKYFYKTRDGKKVLRQMLEKYVPPEVAKGVKRGFSAPDASWFKGESIDYVKSEILNPQAHIYDYLDRESIAELVNEHISGEKNRRLLIWSLLSVEHFCRTFLH